MNKNQMIRLLKTLLEEELAQEKRLLVFGEAEIISGNEGFAVRLDDGKELLITVKQYSTDPHNKRELRIFN